MTEREKKVIEAVHILKEYCLDHEIPCEKCILANNLDEECRIKNSPDCWRLPEIKTRKDTLLEKYPDAQIRPDGIPEVCAAYLGLVAACEGQTMSDCVECWMHEEDKK